MKGSGPPEYIVMPDLELFVKHSLMVLVSDSCQPASGWARREQDSNLPRAKRSSPPMVDRVEETPKNHHRQHRTSMLLPENPENVLSQPTAEGDRWWRNPTSDCEDRGGRPRQ